jgi:hypothetical protein
MNLSYEDTTRADRIRAHRGARFAVDDYRRQTEAVAMRIKELANFVVGADPECMWDHVLSFDPLIDELREATRQLVLASHELDSFEGVP